MKRRSVNKPTPRIKPGEECYYVGTSYSPLAIGGGDRVGFFFGMECPVHTSTHERTTKTMVILRMHIPGGGGMPKTKCGLDRQIVTDPGNS
jgi:hypothetical protein